MFKIHFSGHKNILGGHCLRTPPSRGYGPDQAASLQTFCGFVCWFYEVARSRLIRCRFSVAVYCYVTNCRALPMIVCCYVVETFCWKHLCACVHADCFVEKAFSLSRTAARRVGTP